MIGTGLKRVGILAPPWPIPPKTYGGIEIALDGLCRGLTSRGVEVYLWSHAESTSPVHRGSTTIPDNQEDGWHGAPTEVRHVLEGYAWLERFDVDVIHDVTFAGPLIGPTLTATPIVTTNYLPFYPPTPPETFPDLGFIYAAIARRTPVLAISHGQASAAPESVTRVIHLGTEVDDIPVGDGAGDERGEYVAFLGRMAPEKGVSRAAALAKAAGVRLKIAGRMDEISEHEYFHAEVEPLLDGSRIEYVGEVDAERKADLLRGATALLNPIAWREPFGLTMIESLAAGTPVIATRGGSVEEIVIDGVTGAVCDSDADILAALQARDTFSRAACRERVERHFSNDTMTDNHIKFYREVVAGTRGKA
ncbi:glycosyltransferase [Streptomyces chartreusis]